jgi:glycosyltransferase involved in cell wall biosynthesis
MKIALLAPVWFPVPPDGYGGVELVVSALAEGLVERGHEVTLFASGDSSTKAELRFAYEQAPSDRLGELVPELHHALACFERADDHDLVHDHTGLMGASLAGAVRAPVVSTIQWAVVGEARAILRRAARIQPRLRLVSVSRNQQRLDPGLPWIANCPNAIDLDAYPLPPSRGDYLLFLGRIHPTKGPDRAIAVAKEAGLPLVIAAKVREPCERAFFDEAVRPHLGDGVEFVGEVGHEEKVTLLRGARALLFPIDWEEPGAVVLLEAMACGVPVVATRRGCVPEMVVHGRTGFVVDEPPEMVEALSRLDEIDPANCRAHVAADFSAGRLVRDYEAIYEAVLEEETSASIWSTARARVASSKR